MIDMTTATNAIVPIQLTIAGNTSPGTRSIFPTIWLKSRYNTRSATAAKDRGFWMPLAGRIKPATITLAISVPLKLRATKHTQD